MTQQRSEYKKMAAVREALNSDLFAPGKEYHPREVLSIIQRKHILLPGEVVHSIYRVLRQVGWTSNGKRAKGVAWTKPLPPVQEVLPPELASEPVAAPTNSLEIRLVEMDKALVRIERMLRIICGELKVVIE